VDEDKYRNRTPVEVEASLRDCATRSGSLEATLRKVIASPDDAYAVVNYKNCLQNFSEAFKRSMPSYCLKGMIATAFSTAFDAYLAAEKRDLAGFLEAIEAFRLHMQALPAKPSVEPAPEPPASDPIPTEITHQDDALGEFLYRARMNGMPWRNAIAAAVEAGHRKPRSEQAATKVMDLWCKRHGKPPVRHKQRRIKPDSTDAV
jgi:hypothetical protein